MKNYNMEITYIVIREVVLGKTSWGISLYTQHFFENQYTSQLPPYKESQEI